MGSSEFEHKNEGECYALDLTVLKKNLKLKSNEYESLEYLESVKTECQEGANFCDLQIKKIKKLHKYKIEFPSCPSPLPNPSPSKNAAAKPLPNLVPEKIIPLFPDFLVHTKRNELADKLKSEFKSEKGIPIRLMIEVLRSYDPPLIAIGTHEKTELCNSLKAYFNHDTGSRQGVFPSGFVLKNYNDDLKSTKAKIDLILKSISESQ